MAASDFTTNEAAYVSFNQLADALLLVTSAMRLVEHADGEAACLLAKAQAEIIAAQDYLESIDPLQSPISGELAQALNRIGRRS
ncbi:MAG: hypothetical protein Q8S26_01875 [Azonexus sp.]|nr:hypothetical protein [Azonexus sp.]